MKTKRINKRSTRMRLKSIQVVEVVKDYPEPLIGRTVILRSLPTKIKRAEKLFEVGQKYKIEKSNRFLNTKLAVNLRSKDNKLYYIQFPHWVLTAN